MNGHCRKLFNGTKPCSCPSKAKGLLYDIPRCALDYQGSRWAEQQTEWVDHMYREKLVEHHLHLAWMKMGNLELYLRVTSGYGA